jgi:hypothetical protein
VGGDEPVLLGIGEPTVKYHPLQVLILTLHRYPVWEQRLVGSLTGAVAS